MLGLGPSMVTGHAQSDAVESKGSCNVVRSNKQKREEKLIGGGTALGCVRNGMEVVPGEEAEEQSVLGLWPFDGHRACTVRWASACVGGRAKCAGAAAVWSQGMHNQMGFGVGVGDGDGE